MSSRAFAEIRRMIVRLDLAPGEVIRDDALQARLGIGRTPIREALQRLARDQFVDVIPRRGMFVSPIDVGDLPLLYETRAVLEPYAARLACARGGDEHWQRMRAVVDSATDDAAADELLEIDRLCHEVTWEAAGNRFLTDTLDTLYAHSDRVWHRYLASVSNTREAVDEHRAILEALERGDADRSAGLVEAHVRSFDRQVREAVTAGLGSPLAAR